MMQIQKKPADHLVNAYNQMMLDMRNTFAQFDNTASKQIDIAEISLQQALDIARHKAVRLGKISAEEAIQISEYIKHDINDAAEYMMETSEQFHDWLSLEIEAIERKIIDTFLVAADNTRLELENFKYNGKIINSQIKTDDPQ